MAFKYRRNSIPTCGNCHIKMDVVLRLDSASKVIGKKHHVKYRCSSCNETKTVTQELEG